MNRLVLIIFSFLLFACSSCSSSEEEELLIIQKLSQLNSNEDMFWHKEPWGNSDQPVECVYKWFQNGHIYTERCAQLWDKFCIRKLHNSFPLNKVTIVSESETQLIFVFDDKTYEVNYNAPNLVSIKANSGEVGNTFTTSKITTSKVNEYLEWLTYPKCN